MKAGEFIDGTPYSWEEIYELTGCCREDCIYDMSVECYNLLIEAGKTRRHRKNVTERERLKGIYCQ